MQSATDCWFSLLSSKVSKEQNMNANHIIAMFDLCLNELTNGPNGMLKNSCFLSRVENKWKRMKKIWIENEIEQTKCKQLFSLQHIIQFAIVSVFKMPFCWLLNADYIRTDTERDMQNEKHLHFSFLHIANVVHRVKNSVFTKYQQQIKKKNINTCFMEWIGAQNTLNISIFLECKRNFSKYSLSNGFENEKFLRLVLPTVRSVLCL